MLAGVKGLRWDSCCCPFCGGAPCLLTGVGLGSVWEGALLTVHRKAVPAGMMCLPDPV